MMTIARGSGLYVQMKLSGRESVDRASWAKCCRKHDETTYCGLLRAIASINYCYGLLPTLAIVIWKFILM